MTQEDPRSLPPFQRGERLSASKMNTLREGVKKRIRGMLGRESSTGAATTNKLHSLRERIQVLNKSGATLPEYSLVAVKKSDDIDYFFGPPVITEDYKFEAGFIYATNADFAMADEVVHWMQPVGRLPVLVRYDNSKGEPKIGHPCGVTEDGMVRADRAGFTIVSEPDHENQRVWVTQSNDQTIRLRLTADLEKEVRGEGEAIDEDEAYFKDPNDVAAAGKFIIRQVLNLTGRKLYKDELVFAVPVLGIGYCIIIPKNGVFRGRLANDMCPESGSVLVNVISWCDLEGPQQITASNELNLAGLADKIVHFFRCGDEYFIINVEHVCKNVAIENASCGDQGVFTRMDGCEVQGYVLPKVPLMTCQQSTWRTHYDFESVDLYSELALEYDNGGCDTAGTGASATLTLKGKTCPALTCCADDPQPTCTGNAVWEYVAGEEGDVCGAVSSLWVYDELAGWENPFPCPFGCTESPPFDPPADPIHGMSITVPCVSGTSGIWVLMEGCPAGCVPTRDPNTIIWTTTPFDGQQYHSPCIGGTDDNSECCGQLSTISSLALTETSAYVSISTGEADSAGRQCIYLVPHSFIVFGECDTGTADELICGNPCPTDTSSA